LFVWGGVAIAALLFLQNFCSLENIYIFDETKHKTMITRIETSKLEKILDYAEQNANFEVQVSEIDRGHYSGSLEETLNFNGEEIVLYCDYDVEGTWTPAYISTYENSYPSEWVFSREGIYCAVLFIDHVEVDLYPDQQRMLDDLLSKKCYSEYSY